MRGGHWWGTAAVGVEEDSCLRKGKAEKAEVGRIVLVGVGNRARKEAVGMIELGVAVSLREAEGCLVPYLVGGRYGFQEARWEVL